VCHITHIRTALDFKDSCYTTVQHSDTTCTGVSACCLSICHTCGMCACACVCVEWFCQTCTVQVLTLRATCVQDRRPSAAATRLPRFHGVLTVQASAWRVQGPRPVHPLRTRGRPRRSDGGFQHLPDVNGRRQQEAGNRSADRSRGASYPERHPRRRAVPSETDLSE